MMRAGAITGLIVAACLLGACASAPSHEDMQTTFDAGLKAYDAGDFKTAYEKWDSIDEYDLAALRNVALMLRKGLGVPKNPKAAVAKMTQAADAGLATAQADLGDMLLKGEAGKPDPAAAAPWLARAAAAGHPIAAFQLAQLYETGSGVAKDIEAARKLYEMAAQAGINEAAARLAALPPAAATVAPPPATAAQPAGATPGSSGH